MYTMEGLTVPLRSDTKYIKKNVKDSCFLVNFILVLSVLRPKEWILDYYKTDDISLVKSHDIKAPLQFQRTIVALSIHRF